MRAAFATWITASIVLAAGVATAQAVPDVPTLHGTAKRTAAKGVRLTLAVGLDTDPSGLQPHTLTSATLLFPQGATLNSTRFRSCSPAKLQAKGTSACPAGSKVGSGSASGIGGNPGQPPILTEDLSITAFNGPRGKSVLLWLTGTAPAAINNVLVAKLTRAGAPYSYRLSLAVPVGLQSIAGIQVAVTRFTTSVGAIRTVKGRRYPYLRAPVCPVGATLPLQGRFTFNDDNGAASDALSQTVKSTIDCIK
jgi:hypothetical protein